MKKVQVLLSSYNGEKYIKEQLESILNQQGVEVHCLIRDDGSTDSTLEILNEFKLSNKNIESIEGENIGYQNSFMELVSLSSDFEYYAFADQDDIWLQDKLIKGIEMLTCYDNSIPLLYHSNAQVVNSKLEYMYKLRDTDPFYEVEKRFLLNGFVLGCTCIFNHSAKKIVLKSDIDFKIAHDFWIPILCVLFGTVVYDSNSYILYRQHNGNVYGSKNGFFQMFKSRYKEFFASENLYEKTSKALLASYVDILEISDLQMIKEVAFYRYSLLRKIKLIFSTQSMKSSFRGTVYVKLAVLFSKI